MPSPFTLPARTNVLALDTATERLAVALQAGGRSYAAGAEGGAMASATLLPQVQSLLTQAGLRHAELDFIAFGRGPGAFTGLRTACAVAQGLALGIGKPVLAIDSLLIVAEDARSQQASAADTLTVGVAMDARMDEVYAGLYRWQAGDRGRWTTLQAPALHGPASLATAWAGLQLDAVAGSALNAFGARLVLAGPVTRLPREQDRAAALLRLAVQAADAGEGTDAAQALPLYLRDKVAQTTAERAASRAGAVRASA